MAKAKVTVPDDEIERRLDADHGVLRYRGQLLGLAMLQRVIIDRKVSHAKLLDHGNFVARCWLDKNGDMINRTTRVMHLKRAGVLKPSDEDLEIVTPRATMCT